MILSDLGNKIIIVKLSGYVHINFMYYVFPLLIVCEHVFLKITFCCRQLRKIYGKIKEKEWRQDKYFLTPLQREKYELFSNAITLYQKRLGY